MHKSRRKTARLPDSNMRDDETATVPLFSSLTSAVRAELLRASMVHSIEAGTVLFEQGAMPTFQIVVISGTVQLFGRSSDREVLIEVVRAPDLVIPAAVVSGAPFLMQARVPEPSRFLLIQADVFRKLVTEDANLAQLVLLALSGQFRRMVRQIKNLKLRSATERVGCYILNLSIRQESAGKAVLPYEKHLIASELGITRESFSRALAYLEKHGINVDGQTIYITNRDWLTHECAPDPLIDGLEPPPTNKRPETAINAAMSPRKNDQSPAPSKLT